MPTVEVISEPQPVRAVDARQKGGPDLMVRFLKNGEQVGSTKSIIRRNECLPREERKY